MEPPPNIALIGMMGSGKSTVGRKLASRLGRTFIDTDAEIVRLEGRSIADIFATDGEDVFRDIEAGVVQAACAESGAVIATGGGAILREENRAAIWGRCWVAWLSTSAEESARRVVGNTRRPLLANAEDTLAAVQSILTAREPLYRLAHLHLDTSGMSAGAVADEIIEAWNSIYGD